MEVAIDTPVPVHEFEPERANEFQPRQDVVKTAILVRLANPDDTVTLKAPFGDEVMKGEFYVVASEEGSYGAARAEFEAAHTEVAPNRWVKRSSVHAYQAEEQCLIETRLDDGTHETSVVAEPGDWIVRQATGEVMAVKPKAFEERYESTE